MRKKRKTIYLLFCLTIVLLVSACSKRTDVKKEDTYIYCLNTDRTGLVKVTYNMTEKDTVSQAEKMLKELKTPSEQIEYTAPIPKGVSVNSIDLVGEILYLDYNAQYGKLPAIEEKLIRAAVVQSLVKINGISGIWFSIDGDDITESGKLLGYQNEDDFIQNTGSSLNTYQTDTITLYFANKAGDKLVKQDISVRYSSNTSREKLIVERLMKGPKKNTLYPTINPNVSVLSVTIKDGICYINLDNEFLQGGVDVKPEITIYSLVNSVVEGTTASQVQITVNGEKNATYMDTVDLTRSLNSDLSWVEETEEK